MGGLSAATTLEEVKAYFQRFGEVSSTPPLFSFTLSLAEPGNFKPASSLADWRRNADARQADKPSQVRIFDAADADDATADDATGDADYTKCW